MATEASIVIHFIEAPYQILVLVRLCSFRCDGNRLIIGSTASLHFFIISHYKLP